MVRRWRLVAVVLAVFTLLAAACGGSSGSSGGDDDGTPSTAVATTGGTATIVQPVDAQSLDPNAVINSPSQGSTPISAIYDALYTIDQDTGDFQPRIATSFSSDDGLTWTMKLRDGVMFSDGTPFTADAVLQEWTRTKANPRSSGFSPLNYFVETMTASDATTFVVTLKTPHRYFSEFAPWSSLVWIPSPTAVAKEGENYANAPVGAGPFVLKSRTKGAETVLEKNPTYWQAGLPKLDTLVIKTVPDPQQASDTLTTGGADASVNVPDQYSVQAKDAGYSLVDTNQIGGVNWLFGTDRAPFDDVRARKAVYLALDMDQLNEQVTAGAATVPTGLFPEGTPYYDEATSFPASDPVEAQKLLDELAGEGKPVSFTIIDAGGDSHNKAVGIQTQLAAFKNLEVKVDQLDGATYGTTLYGGNFDLAVYGVGGQTPDPVMQSLNTGWAIPIASMDSADVDAILKQEREAPTVEDRKAALGELAQSINELFRFKWMNVNHAWAAMSPDVAGIVNYSQGTSLLENFGRVG